MATVISTFSLYQWLDGYCDICFHVYLRFHYISGLMATVISTLYLRFHYISGLMATVISTFSLYQWLDGYYVFIISVATFS